MRDSGTKPGGRKHPLYVARENGAESAIRFMADSGLADRQLKKRLLGAVI